MFLTTAGSVMNDRTCSFDLHRGHSSTSIPKTERLTIRLLQVLDEEDPRTLEFEKKWAVENPEFGELKGMLVALKTDRRIGEYPVSVNSALQLFVKGRGEDQLDQFEKKIVSSIRALLELHNHQQPSKLDKVLADRETAIELLVKDINNMRFRQLKEWVYLGQHEIAHSDATHPRDVRIPIGDANDNNARPTEFTPLIGGRGTTQEMDSLF